MDSGRWSIEDGTGQWTVDIRGEQKEESDLATC